jgi:hypothetical protein
MSGGITEERLQILGVDLKPSRPALLSAAEMIE